MTSFPPSSPSPLILWDQVDRFCELLGRTPETVDAILYPPKTGLAKDKGAKKRAYPRRLDQKGRDGVEQLLAMPAHKDYSLAVRPNSGGSKAEEITEGVALFFEADGGLPLEAQEALPTLLGLPEPTFTVWTGGKSLHQYWVAEEGQSLSPTDWRKAQERLIAAVKEVAPHAEVDEAIKDLSRAMRVPGSIHPSSGERCRFHCEGGHRYDLAALVELLPPLPAKAPKAKKAASSESYGAGFPPPTKEEIFKALHCVPRRPGAGSGTYPTYRALLWGLIAALKEENAASPEPISEESVVEYAIGVMDNHSPSEECGWDVEQVARSGGEEIGPGTFWWIAKEHGYRGKFMVLANSSPLAFPASADSPHAAKKDLLRWSELISLTLEAIRSGDKDEEMELRAEIAGRFRRNDSQVDAALFRLLTEQEAGPKKVESADSVDLRTVQGLDYLVDGYLPANGLTLSYGSKGAGKTTSATGLSFAVIEGRGFLDHSKPAKRGKVLFIASDSGAGPLRTILQDMGYGDHPALVPGENQQFFVWAHEADQGHSAWDVSVRGCVKLLQFVKAKGIDLVVIDSAKAVCAKAGLSYTDNDAVNALLTFIKEVITPHTSVLFLSHDGTAVGSHAGAKAWAEIVDVVHRQTKPEGDHHSRTWTVVKNRLGPTREFSYALEDGELVLAKGVETIGDASTAILTVLREGYQRGHLTLSRKGIHEEVFKRFDFAPKTIDNTLQRLVQGKAPKVVRKGKGYYGLSPKELYRGCLVNGEESTIPPVSDCVLAITRALPVGNECQSSSRPPLPEPLPVGNGRVMPTPLGATEETPVSSPRGTHPPLEPLPLEPPVSEFQSVEVFQRGSWSNGWMVAEVKGGGELELFRLDNPADTLCLDRTLVRACRS